METVQLAIEGKVARVALHRPQVRNAFNAVMIRDVTETFEHLQARDDIDLIVLRGNGAGFSAGADVAWMRESLGRTSAENVEDARRMSAMFAAIDAMPQPVMAAVHGACLGGGMGLLAVCDCVIAADNAVFGFTETKLGIIPAVISAFVVPKIGESWARALFPGGEQFGADVAQRIGLVHWIAPPEELSAVVEARVRETRSAGPRAMREAKRLIADLRRRPPDEWRDMTSRRIAEIRTSDEGQEGLRAFLDKRRPAWREDNA